MVTDTPARSSPAVEHEASSDFHLVESNTGWTLTINLTRSALDALLAADDSPPTSAPSASATYTIHVEPNLLPGHPFAAQVVVATLSRGGV